MNRLVIKLTAGAEDAEKCAQAFTVAATAASAGVVVSLWLTGDATWFAMPGRAEEFDLPHATALADLRDAVLAEGTITVCTQCAARRGIEPADVITGVRVSGAGTYVEEILVDRTQALVY